MKKSLIFVVFILVASVFSCKKPDDSKENLSSFLVVGKTDIGLSRIMLNVTISPSDRCTDGDFYEIDFDKDNVVDFEFYVNYCYSPCYYNSNISLAAKQENCKILRSDSIITTQYNTVLYPEILSKGDSLYYQQNWVSGGMRMVTKGTSCSDPNSGGINGIWIDQSDKYIGLMIEKEDYVIYGWAKVTVISNIELKIIELAYKKASYQ